MEPVKLNKLCGRAEKKLGDIPDIQKKGRSLMFGSADFKAQDYLKVSYPRFIPCFPNERSTQLRYHI